MPTTVKLALSNLEVNRIFTRELRPKISFYQDMMGKVIGLVKRAKSQQVYALLVLYQIDQSIQAIIQSFYDEIDKFEGLLERKKHLAGKTFTHKPAYFPEVSFDNGIANSLVELFEVYDRLISQLKTLRTAGCFANDDDYFSNLRRYFKTINHLLSQIMLVSLKDLPSVTFTDAVENTDDYQLSAKIHGEVDFTVLVHALKSNLAPRLEEKIRQPLLHKLKRLQPVVPLEPGAKLGSQMRSG